MGFTLVLKSFPPKKTALPSKMNFNENAKSKVIDINSEYFLIVDHKGKQVWKDWNFKKK